MRLGGMLLSKRPLVTPTCPQTYCVIWERHPGPSSVYARLCGDTGEAPGRRAGQRPPCATASSWGYIVPTPRACDHRVRGRQRRRTTR